MEKKERLQPVAPTGPARGQDKTTGEAAKYGSVCVSCLYVLNLADSWAHYIDILTQDADNISGF